MKLFLGFVLISGVGWLLDMASYAGLSQLFTVPPAYANFISSMVGVTYVWIVALNRLFNRREYGRSIYLPIYWGYQEISILAYSALISFVAASAFNSKIGQIFEMPSALVAKLIITGPNLITNFIFMSFLTKFMKSGAEQKYLP
ncbi:GtrA family protein [Brucella sp. 6810]|uniref:GtrA family protein n=1 Tax=Brucella sp. 6810 TaxID=2769351 RepID=UPI00165A5B5C|nr:GtrA family protein [Brucella sp. 6810]QNQ61398.1 GtrA family protein [Brucella sp. 6810]